MDTTTTDALIRGRGLHKSFPGVHALNDVTFDIRRNTIHCIIGENGAGKSTFIKILTGAMGKSEGQILLDGAPFKKTAGTSTFNFSERSETLFTSADLVNIRTAIAMIIAPGSPEIVSISLEEESMQYEPSFKSLRILRKMESGSVGFDDVRNSIVFGFL